MELHVVWIMVRYSIKIHLTDLRFRMSHSMVMLVCQRPRRMRQQLFYQEMMLGTQCRTFHILFQR